MFIFCHPYDANSYLILEKDSLLMASVFGSTSRCEQLLANLTKSNKKRGRFIDQHLLKYLCIAPRDVKPKIEGLTKQNQCHICHLLLIFKMRVIEYCIVLLFAVVNL
jgi:hypothetical protein